jgi:hypothetical protein
MRADSRRPARCSTAIDEPSESCSPGRWRPGRDSARGFSGAQLAISPAKAEIAARGSVRDRRLGRGGAAQLALLCHKKRAFPRSFSR